MKTFALVMFILMYVLMIVKPKFRPLYALGAAAVFLISGVLPIGSLLSTINWNVLMMISGTMNAGRLAEIAAGTEVTMSREDWYRMYLAAGNRLP